MFGDVEFWRTFNLGFVAVGQTLFVLLYLTFPWYRTFLGRALFYKATTLMVLVDMFMLARVIPVLRQDALFVSLYGLLGIGVWMQLYAFVKTKRGGQGITRRDERERTEANDRFEEGDLA